MIVAHFTVCGGTNSTHVSICGRKSFQRCQGAAISINLPHSQHHITSSHTSQPAAATHRLQRFVLGETCDHGKLIVGVSGDGVHSLGFVIVSEQACGLPTSGHTLSNSWLVPTQRTAALPRTSPGMVLRLQPHIGAAQHSDASPLNTTFLGTT